MIDTKSFLFQFIAAFIALATVPRLLLCSHCCGSLLNVIGEGILLFGISWKLTKWIRKLYFHDILPASNKAVFITGCDSGFGNRLAQRLNALGYTVFAACLDASGSGAKEIQKSVQSPKSLHVIPLDVRSDESVHAARAQVTETLQKQSLKLWAIVNNAGVLSTAFVEWGHMSEYQRVFDVNVFGMVKVTRAFLPHIRKNKGRVINVASIAGRMSGIGIGNYSMSKHAVVAFSCALRREMLPFGVKVSTIEPWIFKTPMADTGNLERMEDKEWNETPEEIRKEYGQGYFDSLKKFKQNEVRRFGRDPEEVIDAMVDGVTAVEPQIAYRVSGIFIGVLWTIQDFLPDSVTDFIYSKVVYRIATPSGAFSSK